jgi:hypothetical protein
MFAPFTSKLANSIFSPTGLSAYEEYAQKVLSYNPVAYYRLNELTGTTAYDLSGNGYNGTYSVQALANTPGPFGGLAPYISGAGNKYINITAAAASAISLNEGAAVLAIKTLWAGTAAELALLIVGSAHFIWLYRPTTANAFNWRRTASSGNQIRTKTGITNTGWIILGIDWSNSTNKMRAYYNGVQEGTDLTGPISAEAITSILLGAQSTGGASEWVGWLAECSLFATPLDDAGHAALAANYYGT